MDMTFILIGIGFLGLFIGRWWVRAHKRERMFWEPMESPRPNLKLSVSEREFHKLNKLN